MRRRIHALPVLLYSERGLEEDTCMCHMRRRIHALPVLLYSERGLEED
jgi:hypothetical protein